MESGRWQLVSGSAGDARFIEGLTFVYAGPNVWFVMDAFGTIIPSCNIYDRTIVNNYVESPMQGIDFYFDLNFRDTRRLKFKINHF